jgi:transposase
VWTDKNRAKYNRDHLRYPSDLTDDEWTYVEPMIPPARRGGGKRRTDMRAVMLSQLEAAAGAHFYASRPAEHAQSHSLK